MYFNSVNAQAILYETYSQNFKTLRFYFYIFFIIFFLLSFRRKKSFIGLLYRACVCQSVRSAFSLNKTEDNKLMFVKADIDLVQMESVAAPDFTILF